MRFCFALIAVACAFANEPLNVESVTVTGADLHVALETQVGRPYDASAVAKDVRYLWGLGRFTDVRAEMTPSDSGAAVRFSVVPKPHFTLHEIRMTPHSFGFQPKLPEGSLIDEQRAHEVAAETEKQLHMQGYTNARVSYDFLAAPRHEVDLRLNIDAGSAVRVNRVEFAGDLGLRPKDVRHGLFALRTKLMIPLLWHILPDYSPEAVDADVARLQSLYFSKGFFDAQVHAGDVAIDGKNATVRFEIQSGPRYQVRNMDFRRLCPCMLAERRAAERQGILDFDAAIHVERFAGGTAEVTTSVDKGKPFRVGRIEFFGSHRYRDSTIRRNFLLDEGAPLDEYLLRKSVARLNQTSLFAPLESRDIVIQRNDQTGVANVKLRLTDRRPGGWNLSGPVGPASLAGPLTAAITSRLPPWGRGIFELSTYTASVSMMAFAPSLIPGITIKKFVPIGALTRPFLPGDSWKSGFVFAPQIGWQGSLLATFGSQLQGRLLPPLTGTKGLTPELPISVDGKGAIFCDAPRPKLYPLRVAAGMVLRTAGAFTGL